MSLIKCPECGHEVSTKAPQCPNCGVPILNNVKRCPVCNTLSLMDAEQCPNCHTKFLVAKASDVIESQASSSHDEDNDYQEMQPTEDSPVVTSSENSPSTPPPPTKKKGFPWWLLILILVLVGVGIFFYYECQIREASEETAFLNLKNCTEMESYKDFINRYPKSTYLNNVRARLAELERIEKLWREVTSSMKRERVQQFIEEHPASNHKPMAIHLLDSIDWRKAEREGTSAAYDFYILSHEDGEHIEQAMQARDEARVREAREELDSINASLADHRDSMELASDKKAPVTL